MAGFQLRRVQQGLEPNDWKPMASIGRGVREIRIHTDLEHRVFYIATFEEAVHVLHAFEKRTRKTPRRYLEVTRDRLRALLATRRAHDATRTKTIKVRRGSSNVFRDLGFPPGEAKHLKVRSDLMIELQKAIASRGLKQAGATKIFGVSQSRVSDLLRGRIDLFSTDALIDLAARLGLRVRLRLRTTRHRRKVA